MADEALHKAIHAAREAVASAEKLLIAAGAGMGVDSGLPDFRGDEGFWRAYPPLRGRRFAEMADPRWFDDDPELAWGFYGHRQTLYERTAPHVGFARLRLLTDGRPDFAFVFTSNVDGHFKAAGFDADRVVECHGSIRHRQCTLPCGDDVWEAGPAPAVDEQTLRASGPLPRCRNCESLARPNVLMFGDARWVSRRTDTQVARYAGWLERAGVRRIVAIEIGAGTAVPTVRHETARQTDVVVRINPREPNADAWGGADVIPLPLPAAAAIDALSTPRD